MSLINNDVCLLVEVDGINLLEEGGTDHATSSLADTETSSNGVVMEAEKRIRREIANSNERRRMQSINAGFQSLRTLLPRHEGEKLSKAAILQQTAEYIYSLEQEKTRLLSQNCQLKRLLNQHEGGDIPSKKRKNENSPPVVSDSSEEPSDLSPLPIGLISVTQISSKQNSEEATELRSQLDSEIRLRTLLEEQLRSVQAHVYTEDVRDLSSAHRMTLHYEECTTMAPDVEERVMLEPECEESRSPSPCVVTCAPGQLMEAAIKAEPRVEVEAVEESVECPASPSRLYLASTSRQNLETIVEAIRHLEGDHLFGEESGDVPLALTMKPEPQPFLISPPHPTVLQTRPGVIVVKHS